MLIFSRLKTAAILGVCLIGVLLSALTFVPAERLPTWAPHPQSRASRICRRKPFSSL
jgi:SecD/SecF fusion protein